METLNCRSVRTCPACVHWDGGGCELERQLDAALAPRAPVVLVALADRALS